MIKIMVIALILPLFSKGQNGLQYTDNSLIRFGDLGGVVKNWRRPGTDSIFSIKVFSAGDTAKEFRYTVSDVYTTIAKVNGLQAALDAVPTNTNQLTNGAGFLVVGDISTKANLASPTFTGTVAGITKSMVGLGNVDNTSDANKPVSSATQTALDGKQATIAAGTTSQYYRGDKTWQTYQGYVINVQALTSSPADGQTVYFGMLPKAPTTSANISKNHIREAGTITAANIYCYSGTAGTNEAWSLYIRINNTTDHLIATVSASTSERIFSKSDFSIAVNAGDYFEIKGIQPTWVTNPLTTIYGGYIYIK